MQIETSRFGMIEAGDRDILSFPQGMLGFSKIHQYVLVERVDDALFLWLQAVKKPSIAFPLLEPQIFEMNYKIELTEEDRKILSIQDLAHTKIFSIVTIPSDPTKMTANLKAPIVINLKNKKAMQVILHDLDYPIRHPIFNELQSYCSAQQKTIFPTTEATAYQTIHFDEVTGEKSLG
jgi:flagellar assembly factor FliW